MNREHKYYVGDAITFRGVFKIDGVEQTPDADSAKVQIWKIGVTTATLVETGAFIVGTQVQYKYTTTAAGEYIIYLTATFNSAADKRTGAIEFVVLEKKAY